MTERHDLHIRDPFVYIENGLYYLLGTTGGDCWHAGSDLTLYSSPDLEHFERIGCMVSEHLLDGYTNVWAPELHLYKGKYYLIVSLFRKDLGRGSMILVSDSLTGSFEPLTGSYITPAGWGCLDATLYCHGGKPYLYFSYEWTTEKGDGAIYVAELSNDLTHLVGTPQRIVDAMTCGFAKEIVGENCRGYVAEGPYVMEENGTLALYWSTIAEDGYCVAKSTAREVLGPYEFEKLVFSKDGGHCMVFTDLQGVRRLTLHQPNVTPNERMKIFAI